jgi:hypothetical protein
MHEFAVTDALGTYPFGITDAGVVNWEPMIDAILFELQSAMPIGQIAALPQYAG